MSSNEEAMQDRDGDSSSDSEAEEVDLSSLAAAVSENPNNYEAHQKYIDGLRLAGDLEKLRAARESMNAIFPLSGKMWQDWAKDEARILNVDRPEEIRAVEALYERGVSEYLHVPLWLDYLEFVEERDAEVEKCTPQGLEKMRVLYERAIVAAGLHMTEGGKVWEAYRDFEEAVLVTLDNADPEVKNKQAERVRKLFRRQLAVPLLDHNLTFERYTEWEAEQGKTIDTADNTFSSAYQRAVKVCDENVAYEESIQEKPVDANLFHSFLLYISAEESKGDPGRVQLLFERAVSVFPATPELWVKYASYVESLKVASICKTVYRRALRNCPWTAELWKKYLLALERFSSTEDEVSAVFEQAIEKPFQTPNEYLDIFLTRIDGLRRRMKPGDKELHLLMRNNFERASTFLATYFPDFVDRSLPIHAYWANVEAFLGNDLDAGRGVWESLAKSSGWMTEVWDGYIDMELRLGNINEARAIYRRCFSRKLEGNGTKVICQAWIRFERENGSFEDLDRAMTKAGQRMEEVRSLQLAQDAKMAGQDTEKQPAPKRKRDKDAKTEKKRQKTEAKPPAGSKPKPEDGQAGVPKPNFPRQKPVHNDQFTVFVSNLDLEHVPEDVRKFFASCEGLKDVRMPKDKHTKQSRRIAYVEFSNEEGVNAAIRKNKTKLNGRKISVSRSNPGAARHGADGVATKVVKPLGVSPGSTAQEGEPPKSNDDFRNMFLKKGA